MAVVKGSGRLDGIGATIARTLVEAGMMVAVTDMPPGGKTTGTSSESWSAAWWRAGPGAVP